MTADKLAEKLENHKGSVRDRIEMFFRDLSEISSINANELEWLREVFLDTIPPQVMKNVKSAVDTFNKRVEDLKGQLVSI